jgi:hypothetical protein
VILACETCFRVLWALADPGVGAYMWRSLPTERLSLLSGRFWELWDERPHHSNSGILLASDMCYGSCGNYIVAYFSAVPAFMRNIHLSPCTPGNKNRHKNAPKGGLSPSSILAYSQLRSIPPDQLWLSSGSASSVGILCNGYKFSSLLW